ncbi:MAG: DUF4381 domain-containing protein [Pseudomonadota bacterium]
MSPEELEKLRDIHLPSDPSWWPLGVGWWIILSIFFILGIFVILWWIRRERRFWYFQARILLKKIDKQPAEHQIIHSQWLLRRVARTLYPTIDIAPLTGKAWLAFLDKTGKTNAFTEGPGQALAFGPYQADPQINWPALRPHLEQWLEQQHKQFALLQTKLKQDVKK